MPIINTSLLRYRASESGAGFAMVARLDAHFDAIAFDRSIVDSFAGRLDLRGDVLPVANTPGDDYFTANPTLAAEFECDTQLRLIPPTPITRTVAADAFGNQRYAAGGGRLFVNGILTPFVSAEINAPSGSLGVSLSIQLAKSDRAQLPDGAAFKFQIGKIINNSPVWTTILDGGKLAGVNYSLAARGDALSFSTFETESKLTTYPRNNLIVFDPAKISVEADEFPKVPTDTGEFIATTTRAVNNLTLEKLLHIAFVEFGNFSAVETDLPNYEIARCDFSISNSHHAAVKQFTGIYEPDFIARGAILSIEKTIDPLPSGFVPTTITAARYTSFAENQSFGELDLDGYTLNYTGTDGSFYADRNLPSNPIENGTFGSDDFTETTVRIKKRDWFETGNPIAVRSELKEEIRETRRGGILIGRETRTNLFDRLGRAAGYLNSVEQRLPDTANNGAPSLLKTSENSQKIFYSANPFAPRQTIQSKIETSAKALLAIDAENTALDQNGTDAPYPQDYAKVYEFGNLKKEMTSEFRTLETTVEYFRPQANGQIEVRVETFDALRGILKNPLTEFRSGDIAVRNFTKQQTKTILRDGVTQATRRGRIEPFNAGELPLFFAEPLARWLLANPRVTISLDLIGFDESLERGVFFALDGRGRENLGNYKVRGYRVRIEPAQIKTTLDAVKV